MDRIYCVLPQTLIMRLIVAVQMKPIHMNVCMYVCNESIFTYKFLLYIRYPKRIFNFSINHTLQWMLCILKLVQSFLFIYIYIQIIIYANSVNVKPVNNFHYTINNECAFSVSNPAYTDVKEAKVSLSTIQAMYCYTKYVSRSRQ